MRKNGKSRPAPRPLGGSAVFFFFWAGSGLGGHHADNHNHRRADPARNHSPGCRQKQRAAAAGGYPSVCGTLLSARSAGTGRCGYQSGAVAGGGGQGGTSWAGPLHAAGRSGRSVRRNSTPSGGCHAQFGVLSGAAALPYRDGPAAAARGLPPGTAAGGHSSIRSGRHGGQGETRRGCRYAAALRSPARSGFYPAAAQCGGYHDVADGGLLCYGDHCAARCCL